MSEHPTFPPLLWGEATVDDAFAHACLRARMGCDAGLVSYNLMADEMQAALVLAPEVPLGQAMAMFPLCGVGFQNALGAIAPPEVAVHLQWDGGIRVNGGLCGGFSVAASGRDPRAVPDWLAVGFRLTLYPRTDRPGETPDQTALYLEGCGDVSPVRLVESWARHTLNWIARWEAEGVRPLHEEWRGLAHGLNQPVRHGDLSGTFIGVDEAFGMLLRDDRTTHLVPLTTLLETSP